MIRALLLRIFLTLPHAGCISLHNDAYLGSSLSVLRFEIKDRNKYFQLKWLKKTSFFQKKFHTKKNVPINMFMIIYRIG